MSQKGAKNGPKSGYFMLKSGKKGPRGSRVCIENRFRGQKSIRNESPKNDEFSERGRGTRGDSLLPPDPQLTIVKIDNIQKNNKKKQTN